MLELIRYIAQSLVENPDQVEVVEKEGADSIIYELHVAPDDMGKVIGRHGRIAGAIRAVMKAAANSEGKRVTVEIR